MVKNDQEKVIAFDTIFTTNHIQILKILLTYVEPSKQRAMAVYIKFLELQYTLSFFRGRSCILPEFPHEDNLNASRLCDEIFPLCSKQEQEHIVHIRNLYQNFENMQEMMQMLQMMRELFPEGSGEGSEGNDNFLSSLLGMPGMPELSGLDLSQFFGMFQNNKSDDCTQTS